MKAAGLSELRKAVPLTQRLLSENKIIRVLAAVHLLIFRLCEISIFKYING